MVYSSLVYFPQKLDGFLTLNDGVPLYYCEAYKEAKKVQRGTSLAIHETINQFSSLAAHDTRKRRKFTL
jgi:hypothetical protein